MKVSHLLVVAVTIAVGTAPSWVPLPRPGSSLVQDVPDAKFPTPGNITEVCGSSPADSLDSAHRLFEGQVHGSETVAVGPDGRLVMLDKFGYLHEAMQDGKGGYRLQTGAPALFLGPGRPLGFHFDAHGNLLVADSLKGLVMVEQGSRRLVLLANSVSHDSPLQPGTHITYANDMDIARDGTVYFSDSGTIQPMRNEQAGHWDTLEAYLQTMYKGALTGRLLRYQPADGSTHVVAEGLWYANGVALAADESFAAVVETCSARVSRVWLTGPKAGTVDTLIDRLPGFPDGITRASDGNFWVALIVPAPAPTWMLRYKLVRLLLAWLPPVLRPQPKHWGAIVKVTAEGQVVDCLLDLDGSHLMSISAVTEVKGRLFLGNLAGDYVSYLDLPQWQRDAQAT